MRTYYLPALLAFAVVLSAEEPRQHPGYPMAAPSSFDGAVRLSTPEFTIAVGETRTVTAMSLMPAVAPYQIFSVTPHVADVSGTIAHGETLTQLIVIGVSPGQTLITYRVESLGRGILNGDVGLVTVVPCQTPVVIDKPIDQTAIIGKQLTFHVRATGVEPLTFDWYVQEATAESPRHLENHSDTLTTAPLYQATNFQVYVSNACGKATGFRFTVAVLPARSRSVKH